MYQNLEKTNTSSLTQIPSVYYQQLKSRPTALLL